MCHVHSQIIDTKQYLVCKTVGVSKRTVWSLCSEHVCVYLPILPSSWLSLLCVISTNDGPRLVHKPENCRLYIENGRELFTADSVEISDSVLAQNIPR